MRPAPVPLAMCAIFRDEAPYLHEWIEFHRMMGVERFFLYDNDSTDDAWRVLRPYVTANIAQVISWPGDCRQLEAYEHALSSWGPMSRWLAFIDIDEFLFSPTGHDLPSVLKWYCGQGIAAIGACWVIYGTGGVASKPDALVTETYQHRLADEDPEGLHVKSIVRPARALHTRPLDPHHFLVDGRAVDERARDLDGPRAIAHTAQVLRINHYISKSEQEARAKMERLRADIPELRASDLLHPRLNAVHDPALLRWVPKLKERLCSTH